MNILKMHLFSFFYITPIYDVEDLNCPYCRYWGGDMFAKRLE